MTNYSRTTLRELKKRYLNILKKCLLANLLAFSFVMPSMAETASEDRLSNSGEKTYTQGVTFKDLKSVVSVGNSHGGAIYNSGTITFDALARFEGNSATAIDGASYGGAIRSNAGSVVFEDMENNAETPVVPNITYGITFNGDTLFTGNKAESETSNSYGGAIWNSGYMLLEGENTFGGYQTDENGEYVLDSEENKISLGNQAKQGGAIYNQGGKKEGDVIAYGMTLGKSTFMGNTALTHGGAIFNSGYMNFTDDALFERNTSSVTGGQFHGGAVFNTGYMNFTDEALFEGNEASSQGGAINNQGSLIFSNTAEFISNSSKSKGGAIWNNNELIFELGSKSIFTGNKSSLGAGLLNSSIDLKNHGTIVFNDETFFLGNIAYENDFLDNTKGRGGGIYQVGGKITFNHDFTFAGNKANKGKDIYIDAARTNSTIDINGNSKTAGIIEGGIAGTIGRTYGFIPQINKTGAGLLVLGDLSENHEYEGAFTQTAGTTIANSERFFSHEKAVNTINGGELKTHGAEIAYKAVVGQNVDDTGAVLSAGKVMHYTTKPEMEVNAETLANITFVGEDMGATIGVGTYNKAEQEKEIALVGDRLVEYVDDKGTEDTSDDELVSYQATDKLFTIDTLASGERTMFKVTGALPNEKGNKIAFANGIVEIGDIQTLADYEFNSSTLKTPRDFEFKGTVTVNNLELSDGLGNLKMKELKVVKDSDLDIKNTNITTDLFTLDGENNVKVSVHSLSDYGQILAKETVSKGAGTLTMNLVGAPQEGVYKVFEQDTDLKLATTHEFFDIADLENGSYKIKRKKTDELAEKFGLNEEETRAVSAVIGGNAENEAFQKVQTEIMETLKSGNKGKAKKALSAVGSKEHPVEQSVASEHLVALQNVVQAELRGVGVGHSGGDTDPRAKVYIKGLYDRTKSSMGEGFRARSKGAVLGVQSEVTEDLTLGVGYATSQTTAKEDLRRTEVDTNTGFISAHYQPNAWWVSGLAIFSRGEYEEEKQVLSSMGKASYDVDSWGAQVMTGYDIKLETAVITPEVGMRYLSVKQEGYTDTLGTTVSGTRSDYLTALVGVKGSWDMGAIRPTAGVTVGYDVISDDVSALNTLANGASYTVNGEALDRLSTGVSLGVEADIGERTTLKLEYSGTFRKEYVDHSGMLKLEMKF